MPYIPETGDSFEDKKINVEDNNRKYQLVQQQHRYENVLRQAKRRKKMADVMGDQKEIDHCRWLVNRRSKRLRDFTNNNKLTRDPIRERPTIK